VRALRSKRRQSAIAKPFGAAACLTGFVFSSCATSFNLPDARIDVSEERTVFELPGGTVTVTHQQFVIDVVDVGFELTNQ
jgi:hypothetical protein